MEILGHSVAGITYRHYAHRAPLAFRAIMTLPQPSAFSAILRGGDSECPCCRRRFADAGTRIVAMGGDHSITGPLIKAAAGLGSRLTAGQKVALVHFDSHTDTYHHLPHWLGSRRSAARRSSSRCIRRVMWL